MLAPLSLKEFYGQTLKAAGFTAPEDSIEKFAEANKLDLETTKIASAVFEQLQLDGVKYDSPQDMFQDALKIAHAYMDHVKEATLQADKLAGDLHRVARHAVEGYLATHGIDLDADEGVKIAGLQARSFQELMQKQAALHQQDEQAKVGTFQVRDQVPGGAGVFNADASINHMHTTLGGTPDQLPATQRQIAADVKPEEMPAYFDAAHAVHAKNPQASFAQVHAATMAQAAQQPAANAPKGLLQRPGLMLGAGALGLGGLYLLKKKREAAEAANNRRQAIQGAAMMPSA